MTDYRPLLSKIVRLADRGTFGLRDYGPAVSKRCYRWQAYCRQRGRLAYHYGKDPGTAVRKLLAVLENYSRARRAGDG